MNRIALKRVLITTLALILLGCSTGDLVTLATSDDPQTALRKMADKRAKSYTINPPKLARDIIRVRNQYKNLLALFKGEVGKKWGDREVLTPSNKRYVKYTENYKSRAIVQFDQGLITVETLDQQQSHQSLQRAIVSTLLTPDDPRAVDLYSAKEIKLTGRPYLYGLVEDQQGAAIEQPKVAEGYAKYLLANNYQTRKSSANANEQVHYVQFKMVSDYQNRQAQNYANDVEQYSKRYGMSKSLVFAIMKTESAFNPFAVSSAPAYGLMQIVPSTAGVDSYEFVKGYKHTPSKEYLFNSRQNIELGTAYLHILDNRYLVKIVDSVKREYATISAYNGGAGNVFNMFSQDRNRAAEIINSLSASEFYRKLRDEHPRDETRRYLTKVLDARKEFINI